jgi:hypothetical protein
MKISGNTGKNVPGENIEKAPAVTFNHGVMGSIPSALTKGKSNRIKSLRRCYLSSAVPQILNGTGVGRGDARREERRLDAGRRSSAE